MQIFGGKAAATDIEAEIRLEIGVILASGRRAPLLAYKIKDCEEVDRSNVVRLPMTKVPLFSNTLFAAMGNIYN